MTTTIAFLGPEGAFTAEAARRAAPTAQRLPLPTITQVVDTVRDGGADLGVVPIENSIEGAVNVTLDALAFGVSGVWIRAELALDISLNLLARPGVARESIVAVHSKAEALAQCRAWFAANLPDAQLVAATSTAEAARMASTADGTVAALAAPLAAELYGLDILVPDIADYSGNATRFVVLGRSLSAPTGADKTSLVVFFGEDRPGLLLRILDEFALRGINLTKVESRPTKQQLGQYCIFIDCAGHITDARVAEALRSVHRHVADLRILGSYPRADLVSDVPATSDTDLAYAEAADWYARLLSQIDP